jgi:hypothetical protein
MKTTETSIQERIVEQATALDLVGQELNWLLNETNRHKIQPGTALGNEIVEKFCSLYRDFQKIQERGLKLQRDLQTATFQDSVMGMVYRTSANLLVRKSTEGIFKEFISVAQRNRLPGSSNATLDTI